MGNKKTHKSSEAQSQDNSKDSHCWFHDVFKQLRRYRCVFVDVHYDEIRPGDQTDTDVLYANCSHHHGTGGAAESCNSDGTNDFLYSVAQLPKKQTAPVENESIYSLAQLP
ncbi:hypothetical protein EYF80_025423 [Liparis tanakae]|uniref:Uncharacterized protein n=1 Tax=Liparis tanakae TaxID=230148 RepID=A0A4Z2HHS1_9TELE|nr:hypothetical protein EYF80_025423 [Liparis tanakae]